MNVQTVCKTWMNDYLSQQRDLLSGLPLDEVERLIHLLREACAAGRTVFVIGNGGNAASGAHFATDLGKGSSDCWPDRFRVVSLADNVGWMTALGNDYSYEDVFVRQLMNFAQPGDIVLASSVSGNSPNLVKAVEWANENGVQTVAMVGSARGELEKIADHVLVIEERHYGRVEDAQMTIFHLLAYAFMEKEAGIEKERPSDKYLSRFEGVVEFTPGFEPRDSIQHVLFDFDGTLSLIRQGWPEVMVPMFVEMLPAKEGESEEELAALALDDIMRLNGKQTIYQMIQLAERITERGGEPREPLWYKHEYLRRLDKQTAGRTAGLRDGSIDPDSLLVYDARKLLEHLKSMGLTLHLASGTDEPFVKQEAELLGLTDYFEGRIFGALDNYKDFSKQMVIERILKEHSISGDSLLSFGDGYVEIENTKQAGGIAVAVASDEANNGSGQFDQWKRNRLLDVGADIVIPDFRDSTVLMEAILNS